MADIKSELTNPDQVPQVNVITWEGLTENDEALARIIPFKSDKTVQITGDFGGATIRLKGSNDGVNYFTLTDPEGEALLFTQAGLKTIMENPVYLKPEAESGTSQDLDIIISAVGSQ